MSDRQSNRYVHRANILLILLVFAVVAHRARSSKSATSKSAAQDSAVHLFDGKSLDGWQITDFAGHGEVEVIDGKLRLRFGEALTGVTWMGGETTSQVELPTTNYEILVEAMRVDGADFFCGLTFPVGQAPCSLILGGWGGGVVGISSINGFDASENETTQYVEFQEERWYTIRLRVTDAKIEAWIDDQQTVDVERAGRTFSVRPEVELSRPLGVASWQTTAAIRKIDLQAIRPNRAE